MILPDPTAVTVAIEAWNADDLKKRELLRKAISSLKTQTYPFECCEILLMCEDRAGAEETLREWLPEARILKLSGATYYRFKNLALCEATGEFLVFADSDVIYSQNWLASMLGAFRPGIDLVAGHTRYQRGLLWRTQELCDWGGTRSSSGFTTWFYGNNLAMRRDLFKHIRFRDDLGRSGGGAINILVQELQSEGVRPWFCHEALAWHYLAPFFPKRLRIGAYHLHTRRLAPTVIGASFARVPLLAPFLVTGGTLLKAWARAWRQRSILPGRSLSLPIFWLSLTLIKAVECGGALAYAWAPRWINRRYRWFDVPSA